jgi:hypothetical protein
MTGTGQSLDGLDTHWFGPASRAMKQGELGEIRLIANDRLFRVVNRDRMKFWRRRQRWLDSLRHASKRAKA